MPALIKLEDRALEVYFLATFAISWGAVLAVVLPTIGIPAPPDALSTVSPIFAASIFALLLGPPVASLALTALIAGRPGLQELSGRIARIRVPARYYAVALVPPTTFLVVLAILVPFDRAYLPGFFHATAPAIGAAFGYALAAGFFEELGWTGFATPRLVVRFGTVRGAILLGLIWTAWHILPVFTFSVATQGLLYLVNLVQSFVFLTSFRVIMTLVYQRTGSVLLNMVLHFSLTASSILIAPVTTPGQMLIWNSLWPISLAVVAVVMALLMRLRSAPRMHAV